MLRRLKQPVAPQPAEIFSALDGVLNLHAQCQSATMIVAELDRMLELATQYFSANEIALVHDDDGREEPRLEVQRRIIDYIANVRSQAVRFDQKRLLPQLRFLDYWLSAHISEQSSPYSNSDLMGISAVERRSWLDQP